MTIINIRGTNGSGKSTVVRELLRLGHVDPPLYLRHAIRAVKGVNTPEAYRISIEGVAGPVFVIGPYMTETGGCDAIQPFDNVLELLRKYVLMGHVVFEGSLVSDHYGQVGALLEEQGEDALMAFMPASLEECLRRVRGRRDGRGDGRELDPKNTTRRYDAIQKVRAKVEAEGHIRAITLPEEGAAERVVEELTRSGVW